MKIYNLCLFFLLMSIFPYGAASAQAKTPLVHIAKLQIDPAKLEAYNAALSIGYDEAFAKIVYRLVLVTKHGTHLPQNNDERFMVDIDLVPFAADNFAERTVWVRYEYPDMPDDAFFPARRAILRGFLARPVIFYTPRFQKLYEAHARQNLKAATECKHGVSLDATCFECQAE